MKYKPNDGRLLVRKLSQKQYVKTNEGIFTPSAGIMNKDLSRGIVIEGDGLIKRGEVVWYSDYSATTFYDEELGQFICLASEDVMVFEGETNEDDKAVVRELGHYDNDIKPVSEIIK